ncbi:hypothetical protein GJ744_001775 [Endocarpon pusillum]|uniref:Uncharacterized protein n=1 Tax=Endocarpon pusillum TaxID=364733 RepID=A0A8H7ACQ0_9EURO|nr:hypothetical protein GJ744_001775 [Endocarpon pusillum]
MVFAGILAFPNFTSLTVFRGRLAFSSSTSNTAQDTIAIKKMSTNTPLATLRVSETQQPFPTRETVNILH